jgi:methylated-DNA-[protein]-cysteine S-methyltransferase
VIGRRVVETALGPLTLIGEDEVLTGVYFPEHRPAPRADIGVPLAPWALGEAARQLQEYLTGERTSFTLDVRLPSTPRLHRFVWDLIAEIPRGETRTYSGLAAALAVPAHPRAVGGAVARNPLSIVVPCHRMLGSSGSLTGYAGGLARKRALLELEGALLSAGLTDTPIRPKGGRISGH